MARQTFDNYVLIKMFDLITAVNASASGRRPSSALLRFAETFIPRLLAVNTFGSNELYETMDVKGGFIICWSRLPSLVPSYFTSGSTCDYLWCQVVFLILQVGDTCSASTDVRMVLVFLYLDKERNWIRIEFIKMPGIVT